MDCTGQIHGYGKSIILLNKTPKQILGDLGYRVDMNADLSLDYDEMILMDGRYLAFTCSGDKLWSARIVETVKPETLYKMYYPLHEASIANGCEKLMKRYQIAAEDLK